MLTQRCRLYFKEMHDETGSATMQPVILVMLVISRGHLNKIVMQPCEGTFIKEIVRKLPEQLVASASGHEDMSQGIVAEMTHNQNNNRDTMFNSKANSKKVLAFKVSQRGQQILQCPIFIALSVGDMYDNILPHHLKHQDVAMGFYLFLETYTPYEIVFLLCGWAKSYQSLTCLIGAKHRDVNNVPHVLSLRWMQ